MAAGLRHLGGIVATDDYAEITSGATRVTRASQSGVGAAVPNRTSPTRTPRWRVLASGWRRAARYLCLPGRLRVGVRVQRRDEQAAAALGTVARADGCHGRGRVFRVEPELAEIPYRDDSSTEKTLRLAVTYHGPAPGHKMRWAHYATAVGPSASSLSVVIRAVFADANTARPPLSARTSGRAPAPPARPAPALRRPPSSPWLQRCRPRGARGR